jgi:diguanylate cyclase (GGDEF)-like protein
VDDAGRAKKAEKLAALRVAYAASLPARLEALADSLRAVQVAEGRQEALSELTHLAHSLAGSAGTFGYRRLSERASELERAVADFDPEDVPAWSARVSSLISAMGELARSGSDGASDAGVPRPSGAAAKFGDRRIVLLEDDSSQAQSLAAQLSMFGWDVRAFGSIAEATTALQESGSCPLVVDVSLSGEGKAGHDLVQRLQPLMKDGAPLVVVSTRSSWDIRLAAVRLGASAYMVKPIDVVALDAHLDRITQHTVKDPFRVLVVDDDELLATHVVETLIAAGMDATLLTDPSLLLEVLGERRPEIVLMDLHLPGCSGVEALQVIRQDPRYMSLPVVFLSTELGIAQHQIAMRVGAEDFLTKPISDTSLIMAVAVRVERFRKLAEQIHEDGLTRLLNSLAFNRRLEAELDRSRREGQSLSLAMLDIDHFKKVNDTYGHPTGDRVIAGLAQLMRKRFRKSDLIGRYGGEEFIVALPNTSSAQAVTILEDLRESFSRLRFESDQGEFTCTFSAGVAIADPGSSVAGLVDSADRALYEAKHSGRNRVTPPLQ